MGTVLQQRRQRYGVITTKRTSSMLTLLITFVLSMSSVVIVTGQNDPCNVCRAPNVMNNPDSRITGFILQLLGIDTDLIISCGDLDAIGQSGALTDRVCVLIQSRRTLRRTCGCALPGAPIQPPPASRPTQRPSTSTDDVNNIDDDAIDDDSIDDDNTDDDSIDDDNADDDSIDDDANIPDDDDADCNDDDNKEDSSKAKPMNMKKKKNSDKSSRR